MTGVAFLGLGAMGFHMAGHLQAVSDIELRAWNRSVEPADRWRETHDCPTLETASEAIDGADLILLCLGRDEDVEHVLFGEAGIAVGLKAGSIVVDHTTTSADLARSAAERLQVNGVGFVDAPVSGGEEGARRGQLSCMLGGAESAIQSIQPILAHYCRQQTRIGDTGAGQMAKMVNQICIAGVLQGLSEGLLFAEESGLDIDRVLQAIGGGAAQSWQMDNRAASMHRRDFDFGFAIRWMVKDMQYALAEAEACGLRLPVAGDVLKRYRGLLESGHGKQDTSALIEAALRDV